MTYTNVRDFSQKRRNRPIAITDIAISKVRKTHFTGFTPNQEKVIQRCHKHVLQEAQALNIEYHSNQMEVGILIDIHTWETWTIHGRNECEVQLKDNPSAYKAFLEAKKNQMMFIHNHPSTGTFSGKDLKFFCLHDALYMMTVVGNDGAIYTLTKTPTFTENVVADYIQLANSYYKKGYINNNGTMAIEEILSKASEYGLEYRKGNHK